MLRTLKRTVAKNRMKALGYTRICHGKPSFFSKNWRTFLKTKKGKKVA